MENLDQLIDKNLKAIFKTEKLLLNRNQFCDMKDKPLQNPENLIAAMEEFHLIETELDHNTFYLTEYGYIVVETGGWFSTGEFKSKDFREVLRKELKVSFMDEKTTDYKKIFSGAIFFLLIMAMIFSLYTSLFNTENATNRPSEFSNSPKNNTEIEVNQHEAKLENSGTIH